MSSKSNDQGRAFEMACLLALVETIAKYRGKDKVVFVKNSSFEAAEKAWNHTDNSFQETLMKAANAMTEKLAGLEPIMVENDSEIIVLKIQKAKKAKRATLETSLSSEVKAVGK